MDTTGDNRLQVAGNSYSGYGNEEQEINLTFPEDMNEQQGGSGTTPVTNNDSNNTESKTQEEFGGGLSVDAMQQMKEGTSLMKYGKYGKPKYRMFQLSPDHKYLVWYSPKKDVNTTRVPIDQIQKILIAEESDVATKSEKEIKETSFTVVYGKTEEKTKSLTVTAKNATEAYVWAQGLKILSDAAKFDIFFFFFLIFLCLCFFLFFYNFNKKKTS